MAAQEKLKQFLFGRINVGRTLRESFEFVAGFVGHDLLRVLVALESRVEEGTEVRAANSADGQLVEFDIVSVINKPVPDEAGECGGVLLEETIVVHVGFVGIISAQTETVDHRIPEGHDGHIVGGFRRQCVLVFKDGDHRGDGTEEHDCCHDDRLHGCAPSFV